MLGNFTYCNPTAVHFGKDAMGALKEELSQYGSVVQLVYGGGSIKRTGIYDQVIEALEAAGKTVVEDAGVMPNPTVAKLLDGVRIARENKIDFILAVGGGSVIDYSKALSASVNLPEDADPWELYFEQGEAVPCDMIPIGAVLTMVGTGSEMNNGSVITNEEKGLKYDSSFGQDGYPKFAILNPEFTFTLPQYQMVAGIFDIMSHINEQYFSGEDDNTSDYLAEGLMRGLVHASLIAVEKPKDYEARSNIMWTATWALNSLIGRGKSEDWEVHMIGQAMGAITNATHGMTLASVALPYYRLVMPYGLPKFVRFATAVWGVDPAGKTDEQVAEEGLAAMEAWMRKIGCVMSAAELGVTEDNIDAIVRATLLASGGYHQLTEDEVYQILRESMAAK